MENRKLYKVVAVPRDDQFETFIIGYYPALYDAERAILRHFKENPEMIYEYQLIGLYPLDY